MSLALGSLAVKARTSSLAMMLSSEPQIIVVENLNSLNTCTKSGSCDLAGATNNSAFTGNLAAYRIAMLPPMLAPTTTGTAEPKTASVSYTHLRAHETDSYI